MCPEEPQSALLDQYAIGVSSELPHVSSTRWCQLGSDVRGEEAGERNLRRPRRGMRRELAEAYAILANFETHELAQAG